MEQLDNFLAVPTPRPLKKPMKALTCRKCEGHGITSILKGHAAFCQFNNCQCEGCQSVMSLRANALIRRFRHRQPGQNHAVLRTIRSKNGNTRLRIQSKNELGDEEHGTNIMYQEDGRASDAVVSPPISSGTSSPGSLSMSVSPVPPSPDQKIFECLQQILANQMFAELFKPLIAQQTLQVPQFVMPLLSPDLIPSILNA